MTVDVAAEVGPENTPDVEADLALGAFLRARRARLRPEDVGIPSYGPRRVPGLRREEIARLAGVSSVYYARLEQGQATNASPDVVDALARALALDETEHTHLRLLAHPRRPAADRPMSVEPPAGLVELVRALDRVPALVVARNTDVLAWNVAAQLLLAHHLRHDAVAGASPPNLTRLLFTDPETRGLYREWEHDAEMAVAALRYAAARFPDDRAMTALIGELVVASDDFAQLWAQHPVTRCVTGIKLLRHPVAGDLELRFNALDVPDGDGVRLLTYNAEPGTRSAEALAALTPHG